MTLEIKERDVCKYDAVSLGEVMLRLDPGDLRIRTARNFQAWEGGGEYNVVRGLSKCFRMDTAVVTALADNEVGYLIEDFIQEGGVDTSYIKWFDYDGIGRTCRNGINFTERGFGVRGSLGVSDRANTATSHIQPGMIDWEKLFGEDGVRWFHTGGIYAGLSPQAHDVILEAVRVARKYGTIVSYDLNYRPSLWQHTGGYKQCQAVNRKIAPYVDVLISTRGFDPEDTLEQLTMEEHIKLLDRIQNDFPNLKIITDTLRKVNTASNNDWSAFAYVNGEVFKGQQYDNLDIFDRVGGGDSYASGLIYGLMSGYDVETSVNYGLAHGALAMTTPGDASMSRLDEVEHLMSGGSAAVKR